MSPSRRGAVAILPAIFWMAYSLWNTVLQTPPAIGPVTAINLLYIAMLPAAVICALRWRRCLWTGKGPYLLFLAWVLVILGWLGWTSDVGPAKGLLVYGLLGLTAAQFAIGSRVGPRALAGAQIVVATGLSAWTIWHALVSGFAYRAGVPLNPNVPATIIGPGLLAALTLFLRKDSMRGRRTIFVLVMVALYACVLLGSRGVLLAVVGGVAFVLWRARPSLRDAGALVAGCVVVGLLAQVPAIPHRLWLGAVWLGDRAQATLTTTRQPLPDSSSPVSAAAPGPPATASSPAPASSVVAPLDPTAAKSTAIARFGEQETASFNLRSDLWRACLRFIVSGPRPFLMGGGLGTSQALAHQANPVFASSHNAYLQVAADFGLIGLALVVWFHWQIVAGLRRVEGWLATAALAGVTFWAIVGLTATVTDIHLYWVGLGAAAAIGTAVGKRT